MYRCFFINETPIRKSSSLQKLNVFTIYLTVHKTKLRQFVLHVIHTTIYGYNDRVQSVLHVLHGTIYGYNDRGQL